jgi:hypothetical protein
MKYEPVSKLAGGALRTNPMSEKSYWCVERTLREAGYGILRQVH